MPLIIYKSSAGSGKTYTLVREYVRLLIVQPSDFRHVLAITFTNKATEEMKHRIVSALNRLANGTFDALQSDLLNTLPANEGYTPLRVQIRAKQALNNILHAYSDFSISTIDSFFQRILRNFSKELKLPMRYEIEMDTKHAIEQVIARLMTEIGHVEALTKYLENFTFAQMEDDKGWKIDDNMRELGAKVFQERIWERLANNDDTMVHTPKNEPQPTQTTNTPNPQTPTSNKPIMYLFNNPFNNDNANIYENYNIDITNSYPTLSITEIETDPQTENETETTLDLKLEPNNNNLTNTNTDPPKDPRQARYEVLQNLVAELIHIKKTFDKQMAAYASEAIEMMQGYGLEIKDFKAGTANWFEKIAQRDYELTQTLLKIANGNQDEWRSKTSAKREKIDQLVQNGLQQILQDAVAYLQKNETAYYSANEVLKNIYTYGILNDVKEKLKDYRTENSTMLIADINNILHAIIGNDDAPFIFEKVGTTFKHVLIDEFQDTSDFQWLNLMPLVSNTLANQQTALIVGDVKQSIYRWRGGNMQLLMHGLKDQLNIFFDPNSERELTHNYRSRQTIVEFNNAFFEAAAQHLQAHIELPLHLRTQIGDAYKATVQQIKHRENGYVKIQFLESEKGNSWKQQADEQLLKHIQNLNEEGIGYGNIAVLVRTNTEGSRVAEILSSAAIKVVSSESLLMKNSLKVRLLISAFRYIADRRDIIAKTELLMGYLDLQKGQNNQEQEQGNVTTLATQTDSTIATTTPQLHELYTDHLHYDAPDCLFKKTMPKAFVEGLDDLAGKSLYEMTETLVQMLDLANAPDAYVQRFQDLVLENTGNKAFDLQMLLEWWDRHSESDQASIIAPQGNDAVTIITVHKAKGLEYPIVIMPYCDWKFLPDPSKNNIIWTNTTQAPFDQLGIVPLKASKQLENTYFAETYQQEELLSYIDNLNIMYVAFTRPTQQLYLLAPMFKTVKLNSAAQLLYYTITGFEYTDFFDGTTLCFQMGNPDAYKPEQHAHNNKTLNTYLHTDYQQKLSIRSQSDRFFLLFDHEQAEAIRTGQKIHAILEKLQSSKDLDKIIRQTFIKGLITEAEMPTIRQRIQQIFELKEVQQWFNLNEWDEVLCEHPLMRNRQRRIPDRVMFRNKQATVVDYKTGSQNPKHETQLRQYTNILTQMGYDVADQFLLYIGQNETTVQRVEK